MKSFYLTDPGKVRTHNEDSVTILKNESNEYLMIVADGMGGHRAGEVASSMVVTYLGERFNSIPAVGTKLDAVNFLIESINEVNSNIIKYATQNSEEANGMGTTAVMAIFTKEYLIFGNIGDSSGFVLKNKKLHKVTKDHTLVNLLIEAGNLTKEEAMNHPKKNVLMKALGAAPKAEIDIFEIVDKDFDAIFLCSDGLTNMVTIEQIEKILNDNNITVDDKVKKLVAKSNLRGGTDNISVAYLLKEEGD